jgi:hypothetical protein
LDAVFNSTPEICKNSELYYFFLFTYVAPKFLCKSVQSYGSPSSKTYFKYLSPQLSIILYKTGDMVHNYDHKKKMKFSVTCQSNIRHFKVKFKKTYFLPENSKDLAQAIKIAYQVLAI